MAEISIYSGDFREAISELDALNASNALTGTAHDDIMKNIIHYLMRKNNKELVFLVIFL